MKRWEPIAYPGPDNVHGAATHRNFNQGTGERGSWPDGLGYQQLIDELCNAIEEAGGELDGNLSTQLAWLIQSGGLSWAVATGTANAWVVDPAFAVPAYKAGRVLWVKAPATNTSTTVNMNVSGLGNRRIKKGDGSDPAPGDLLSGRWYPTLDDGTNICVISFLRSDLAAQKSPFNRQQQTTSTRTLLNATGGGYLNFTSGSYTKQSATSKLLVRVSTNLCEGGLSQNCSIGRLTIGGSTLNFITKVNDPPNQTTAAAPFGEREITGLAAGALSWTLDFGRADATAWRSIINPISSDWAVLPATSSTTLIFEEIEP